MDPALYAGTNGGISPTSNANNTDFENIIVETHIQRTLTIKPLAILLDLPHDRERPKAATIMCMINTARAMTQELVFIASSLPN